MAKHYINGANINSQRILQYFPNNLHNHIIKFLRIESHVDLNQIGRKMSTQQDHDVFVSYVEHIHFENLDELRFIQSEQYGARRTLVRAAIESQEKTACEGKND
jgi:hypothetical protein